MQIELIVAKVQNAAQERIRGFTQTKLEEQKGFHICRGWETNVICFKFIFSYRCIV